jgi:hypothetical protein
MCWILAAQSVQSGHVQFYGKFTAQQIVTYADIYCAPHCGNVSTLLLRIQYNIVEHMYGA